MQYIPFVKDLDFEKIMININEIDFEGQKLSDFYYHWIINIFTIIAMIVSFYYQKLSYGVFICIVGILLAFIVCIPPWPMYNRNNINWLSHNKKNNQKEKKI